MGKKRQKLYEREINKETSIPVIPPSRKRVNELRSDTKKIVIDNKSITLGAFFKRNYIHAVGDNAGKEVSREDKKDNLTIVDGKPLINGQPIILANAKDAKIMREHDKIVIDNKTITFGAFLKRKYVYANGDNAGKAVSRKDKISNLTIVDGKPLINGQPIIRANAKGAKIIHKRKKIIIDNETITVEAFLMRNYVYENGDNAGKEVSRKDKRLHLTIVDGKPLINSQPIIRKNAKIIRSHEKIVIDNKNITFGAFLKRNYVYENGDNAGKEVSKEDKRLHLTMVDGKPLINGQPIIESKYYNFDSSNVKKMDIAASVNRDNDDLLQSDSYDTMNVDWNALIHDTTDTDWNVLSAQAGDLLSIQQNTDSIGMDGYDLLQSDADNIMNVNSDTLIPDFTNTDWNAPTAQLNDAMNVNWDALIHDPIDTDWDAIFSPYDADPISIGSDIESHRPPSPQLSVSASMAKTSKFRLFHDSRSTLKCNERSNTAEPENYLPYTLTK